MKVTEKELKKAKTKLPRQVFRRFEAEGFAVLKGTVWTYHDRIIVVQDVEPELGDLAVVTRGLTGLIVRRPEFFGPDGDALYLGKAWDLVWLLREGYTTTPNYITRRSDERVFEIVSLGVLVELRHMPKRGVPSYTPDVQTVHTVVKDYREAFSHEADQAGAALMRLYDKAKTSKKIRAVKEPPPSPVRTKYQMMLESQDDV